MGVCEGIAKSVKVLCDALGIWCIIVISEANPEKKIKYRHAWNIVKIGKTYYHLDATFDLSLSKTLTRHDYFNLSDDAIFRDHEPIMTDHVPCTDGSHFYYLEKKLSFTKQEEVKKASGTGCQKEKAIFISLAWRLSDKRNLEETSNRYRRGSKGKRQTGKSEFKLDAGSTLR